MRQQGRKQDCCGCGACADICHVKAIHMVQDKEGFFYPQVNRDLCVECGRCIAVCPLKDRHMEIKNNQYFGVRASDDGIRMSSSSGGIFSVLAGYIFQQHGVVYGAGYDADMHVRHIEIEDLSQLERIKRTKYVQSNMSGIYQKIEKRLAEGRWVLFCGTPCQAYALRRFLNKPYEKLIFVDLVCYGVPSPGMWSDYVKYLEGKYKSKMTDFSFRDKRNRDNGQMCSWLIGGKEYVEPLYQNKYGMMYFGNLNIRPSCHECNFCTVNRESDFTIGDFWGIENIRPDLCDGMGVSLMILHTDKAKEIWENIKKKVSWFECKEEDVYQPRLLVPTAVAKERNLFMALYRYLPFSLLMKLMDIALGFRKKWKR